MECPACSRRLNFLEELRASFWAEYECPVCKKRSRRTKSKHLITISIIIAIPIVDRMLNDHGVFLSMMEFLPIAFLALVLLTHIFGRLELVDVPTEKAER